MHNITIISSYDLYWSYKVYFSHAEVPYIVNVWKLDFVLWDALQNIII